jgi:hypothetical protein
MMLLVVLKAYEAIVKGEPMPHLGIPESLMYCCMS